MTGFRMIGVLARVFCGVALSVVAGDARAAGEGSEPAVLSGAVLAPDGSRIPGAQVTLTEPASGAVLRTVSGEEGVYRLRAAAGAYTVGVSAPGFESQPVEIVLAHAERRILDLSLRVATLSVALTVVGRSPHDSLEAAGLRESSARDAGEALGSVAGVVKLRKGGIANDVVLRGFQGANLNMLVDGERIYGACPGHMDPPAFHTDFAEIERVEVGKGPFDVKNAGSLGGVVNIVTRRPEGGWHANLNLAGGSYGYVNPSATASWAGARATALGGLSWRRSDPYRDGSGRHFTEPANYRADARVSDAFRALTGWGKLSFVPAERQRLQLSYTRQDVSHVLYPYLQMDAVYDDADRAQLAWERVEPQGRVRALRAQTYFTAVDHWMTDEWRTSSTSAPRPYSMGTRAKTRTAGARVEAVLAGASAGLEAYHRTWDARTELQGVQYRPQASLPGATLDVVGAYAEYARALGRRVRLSVGARVDAARSQADSALANAALYYAYHGTRDLSAGDVSPSGHVRATWAGGGGFEASLGLGSTVRLPDPQERYYALQRMGSDWVGNPALRPSRNNGVEASLSWRRAGLSLSTSVFHDRVDDFVDVYRQVRRNTVAGVMNTSARSYANVDATLSGAEAELSWAASARVLLSASGSFVRGSQDGDPTRGIAAGNLAEMPPAQGRARARWDEGRVWGEAEGVFAGRQERVDAALKEPPSAGWAVLNLRAGARRGRLALTVVLSNVFDRQYSEHLSFQRDPFRSGVRVPEPGRNLHANLAWRF